MVGAARPQIRLARHQFPISDPRQAGGFEPGWRELSFIARASGANVADLVVGDAGIAAGLADVADFAAGLGSRGRESGQASRVRGGRGAAEIGRAHV